MANASALPNDYEQDQYYNDEEESEEEDENELDGDTPGENKSEGTPSSSNKQNGSVSSTPYKNVDKYGFTGGEQYTDRDVSESKISVGKQRKRELKWLDMLENWEKWMSKRFKKVKERCRKGIPPALRARAWQYLCGSKFLMDHNKGRYEEYLKQPGDPHCCDDIRKDLHRQFPFHEMFIAKGGHGQEDLFAVLKAYTVHNPVDGYCQAQAPIAAVLLMHMPAEQAFWCLVSICEKYLPGYYSQGLEAVQTDGDVLFGLLKRACPLIYKHLKKHRVEPILYMTEWFMCVFTRTLPWTAVLRVWDMFFCEGVKVMFRIALVLFRSVMGRPDQLAECQGLYETMEKIRHIPHEYMHEEYLVRENFYLILGHAEVNVQKHLEQILTIYKVLTNLLQCAKLPVSERDMEKEHQHQLARRRALKDKANKPDNPGKSKKKSKKTSSAPPESSS